MWKFLESEMKVILGLTEDASRTDTEIADIYGLKNGTVASIRRRLIDAGAITFANVPAFNRLGCEMIALHMGTTEPSERTDTKVNYYLEFCSKCPKVFHGLMGGTNLVLYTVLKNATEYGEFIQEYNEFFSGPRRMAKARLLNAVFPFSLSRGSFVPNFAGIVHRHSNLNVPAPEMAVPTRFKTDPVDLSQTEKLTLVALVENPDAPDRQLSDIVGLSRQAVTRIRNRLLEDGIYTRVCIPRLYKWGFEICAVTHTRFNMEIPWDKRLKSQPSEMIVESFFTISKADEAAGNYISAKFSDYTENLDSRLAWYTKMKLFDDKPSIFLFSLDRCAELRTFDYAPALRSLLLA